MKDNIKNTIYEDEDFYIIQEPSQIPWVIIHTKKKYKELHDMSDEAYIKLMKLSKNVSHIMSEFYKCDKINIASFGNYLPRVHIHIQARFVDDEYFPDSMWGQKKRQPKKLNIGSFDEFKKSLTEYLQYKA